MTYTPMQLALAFIKTGELTDAIDALDQQLHNLPQDQTARRLRAQVLQRLGRYDEALDDLNDLLEPNADDEQQRSILFERMGALHAATQAMHAARALSPGDERMAERLLDLHLAQNQLDEALALVRAQPRSWRWLQHEGDVLVLQGNDAVAIARYGLVLAHLEDAFATEDAYVQGIRARVLLARAHAYRRTEHYALAQEHYAAAQALVPADPTIAFYRGVVRWLQGETDAGRAQCQSALADAPQALRKEMLSALDDTKLTNLRQTLQPTA